MSPSPQALTYWHAGGDLLTLGGRPLSAAEIEALERFHYTEAERLVGDAQGFHLRCAAELARAIAAVGDWTRASRQANPQFAHSTTNWNG